MIKKMPRAFNKIIFFGGPQCEIDMEETRYMLERAFDTIGGLQQPCHCDRPCDCAKIDKEGWEEIERIVRDIAMALTGREIIFAEKENEIR